jgi:hypothetical protein
VNILFVHGMGRTPLSAWRMLRKLKQAGHRVHTFAYFVSVDSFEAIRHRLHKRLRDLAAEGEYCLIGHSLGGVLLRAALADASDLARPPRRVFLLGSPMRPSRLAARLKDNWLFRLVARDCGQLLASPERMEAVPWVEAPTTVVMGTRGLGGRWSTFGSEKNDGIVALSEARPPWPCRWVEVPVTHTFLPSHRAVANLVLRELDTRDRGGPIP